MAKIFYNEILIKMKNLDLNGYGVLEMNAEEMKLTEGGGPILALVLLVASYYALEVVGNPEAHLKAAKDGWNSL